MDLTLTVPAAGPSIAIYRLTGVSVTFQTSGPVASITINYTRNTAAGSIIDVQSDVLTPAQMASFFGGTATAGQTLRQLLEACVLAYVQATFGAVTATNQ